jgi:hypothetical protein
LPVPLCCDRLRSLASTPSRPEVAAPPGFETFMAPRVIDMVHSRFESRARRRPYREEKGDLAEPVRRARRRNGRWRDRRGSCAPCSRSLSPLLSGHLVRAGAVRLGKLSAPFLAPPPRCSLGACLGARTLRLQYIGWVLAPLQMLYVPRGPSTTFGFPVWSARFPCCQGCRACIGSASATRCAGPTCGCAFRVTGMPPCRMRLRSRSRGV